MPRPGARSARGAARGRARIPRRRPGGVRRGRPGRLADLGAGTRRSRRTHPLRSAPARLRGLLLIDPDEVAGVAERELLRSGIGRDDAVTLRSSPFCGAGSGTALEGTKTRTPPIRQIRWPPFAATTSSTVPRTDASVPSERVGENGAANAPGPRYSRSAAPTATTAKTPTRRRSARRSCGISILRNSS